MTRRSFLLTASSGILLAVAFPTFDLHAFAWIALVPLLLALRNASSREGFVLGGLTGLLYFVGTVSWVMHSMHYYGGMGYVPSVLVMLLLCAYLALYPALFGAVLAHLLARRPRIALLAAPALWTALELARTYVFTGFPWALLGYSQYRVLPVIQIADITGVYGVSFFIVMVNAAIAGFLADRKQWRGLVATGLVAIVVLGYGARKLRAPEPAPTVSVSVVQGNIPQDQKWDRAFEDAVVGTYERLTRQALASRPDVVIWPETATPFDFTGVGRDDSDRTAALIRFVKQGGVPLLFGSPTYEVEPNRRIIGRNSAFLLSGQGRILAEYDKMHLVPFGEYVPLRHALFFVGRMVQAIGDFRPGHTYTVMTLPGGTKLCTAICYEIIFPDLVRRFVNEGAQIVTTITNDAWFGKTAAPYQHFSMAVFRAVENRVPVARAANTGISGFIDSRGRILAESRIFTEAEMTHLLAPGTERTFYTRHGDLFSYACSLFILLLLVIPARLSAAKRDA